jgi:hypothetical protein
MFQVPNFDRSVKIYKARKITLPRDFRTLYRFEEANLEWVASHFLGQSEETRGGALSPKQRMQIFLRYIADPGFQIGVGEDLGVTQSTACKVIHEVFYVKRKLCNYSVLHLNSSKGPILIWI